MMKYEIQQSDDGYLLFAGEKFIAETPTRRDAEKIQAALEFSDDNHPPEGAKRSKVGVKVRDCVIGNWYWHSYYKLWFCYADERREEAYRVFTEPDSKISHAFYELYTVYPIAEKG